MKTLALILGLSLFLSHCSNGSSQGSSSAKPKPAAGDDSTGDEKSDDAKTPGTDEPKDPGLLAWEDVQPITKKFCEDCHLDEGFDRPESWKGIRDLAIDRLSVRRDESKPIAEDEAAKHIMPPLDTKLGKTMTNDDKVKIVAWLKTLDQVAREEIGDVKDPVGKKISGDLKAVADVYCVSCHGNDLKFYTNAKASATKQVTDGTMPKGKTLPAAEKQKLLNALKAL